jgi:hypothetical protein
MSERSASLALPPALRITWASPSWRPSAREGRILASMHVTIAIPRAGGSGRFPRSKVAAYASLALSKSSVVDMRSPGG